MDSVETIEEHDEIVLTLNLNVPKGMNQEQLADYLNEMLCEDPGFFAPIEERNITIL